MKNPFEEYLKYEKINGKIVNVNAESFKTKDEAFLLFKSLYNVNYGSIKEDDNLISIHTGGWSDNEELIFQFKETWWWSSYHQITANGGHYFFNIDKNSEKEWFVSIRKY